MRGMSSTKKFLVGLFTIITAPLWGPFLIIYFVGGILFFIISAIGEDVSNWILDKTGASW